MALENFSAYTEVDPNSRISKTATRVTWTSIVREEIAHVSSDKGVNHFDGDFTHLLTVNASVVDNGGLSVHWAISNVVDSFKGLQDASEDGLFINFLGGASAVTLNLQEMDGGSITGDQYTYTLGTTLYLKITRDESIGTYGTIFCFIYSDAARTVLVDTLSVTLNTSKKDFRYIYGFQSWEQSADSALVTGYTENMSLFKADAGYVATYPTVATTRVTSIIHRFDRGIYNMVLGLGEVVADFGIPEWETTTRPSVPTEEEIEEEIARVPGFVREPREIREAIAPVRTSRTTLEMLADQARKAREEVPGTRFPAESQSGAQALEQAKLGQEFARLRNLWIKSGSMRDKANLEAIERKLAEFHRRVGF